jgi:hypothetical protein
MSNQNFKIKNGLTIGNSQIIDSAGNITLPDGANITIGGSALQTAVSWNDIVDIPENVINKDIIVATNGQTVFPMVYALGTVDVYLNGIKLTEGLDYTATNGNSVILNDGTIEGDIVELFALSGLATYLDANVYTKVQIDSSLSLKADQSTTYTKTEVDSNLALKADQSTTYTKTEVDGIITNLPPEYSDSDVSTYLSANGYDTSTNIVSSIVDTAPTTLNTLNELAAALGDDPNFATTISNQIGLKANQSSTYTKSEVDSSLSLKADTVTVNTGLALKADVASTYTKTQVDSALSYKADTTLLNSELTLKANQSSTYTKTEVDSALAGKQAYLGYAPVNKTGDTMTGLLNVPSLQIGDVTQMSIKKHGDVSSGSNLNDQAIRNSIFYSLGAINSPHSNNGVGMYLSTYGLGGTSDNSTDERAAQIYFGDTAASGMFYRVKQGVSGWHPWVSLSSGIRGVWYNSTNAHTYTTTQDGFTTLETTFIRTTPSASSKFLIIATVAGAAGDDGHARLEFYDGANWVIPAELIGQGNTGNGYANGSFGDFSITRAVEDKQILQYTATIMHSPGSTAGTLGYRVRMMAENAGGLYMNRPMGWDNGFNSNTSRSSIIIMEMTGNNNG